MAKILTQNHGLCVTYGKKTDKSHGHRIGLAKFPKKLTSSAIKNLIYEAWKIQGIRTKLAHDKKRHEFKSTHCFRKIFETKCQKAKMNHNNIKILMDHSLGESQNYHRPTEEELLEDYLNAIELLTVNEENRLRAKLTELMGKQDEVSLMKLKHERDMNEMREQLGILMESRKETDELLSHPEKLLQIAQTKEK